MGRLKEFEINEALGKAMHVFWLKGYDNTSLKDLLSEMDILNGSFYNTFGNKKNLFIKSLEYYDQNITATRASQFDSHKTFKKGLRSFFNTVFECIQDRSQPRGCLLTNSLSSELMKDEEIRLYVQKNLEDFQSFFKDRIDKAIKSGELDNSLNSEQISFLLITYIQGIMKMSCAEQCGKKLEKQTQLLLNSLGL